MVICSECGTRVAPKVTICPKCGASVDATNAGPPARARWKVPWRLVAAVLLMVALAGLGAYLLFRS